MTFIASDDDGGPGVCSEVVVVLDAGSYQAAVEHRATAGTGPYTLSVLPAALLNGPLPDPLESEPNDSAAQANPWLLPGEGWDGEITAADADWFGFTLAEDRTVTLSTHLPGDPAACGFDDVVDLFADDGVTLLANSDNDSPGACGEIVQALVAGAYLVRVQGVSSATGSYTLSLSAPPPTEVEPNDCSATADGPHPVPCSVLGAIDAPGDTDWLRFELTTAGDITFATDCGTGTDTSLTLYAADGVTSLGFADGVPCESMTRTLAAGTYFLEVAYWDDSGVGAWEVSVAR